MRFAALLAALLLAAPVFGQSIDQCIQLWGYSVPKVIASNGNMHSNGSGVYLGNNWVLTNQHVVEGTQRIVCDFQGRRIQVSDHLYSKNSDQALLRLVSDPGVRPVPLVRQRSSDVVFAGYDRGTKLRFYTATRSMSFNSGSVEYVGQHAGAISGDSGGPAFADGGCVANLWGGFGNSGGRGTVANSNQHTISFIERAAQKFPDLAPLIPGGGGGVSMQPPSPAQPIVCINGQCQPQQAAPLVTQPQTPTVPIVQQSPPVAGACDLELPLTIRLRMQPDLSVSVGALRRAQ